MKIHYNREEDILLVETGEGNIDHAEEMGRFVIHFSKDDKPVLIEIFAASEFLSLATKSSITAEPIDIP